MSILMNKLLPFIDRDVLQRRPILIVLGLVLGAFLVPAFAAPAGSGQMDWGNMAMKLLGGLALFLFGM